VIHLDTSFAIDLLREERRGTFGPAHERLESFDDEPLGVSVFVVCELEAGLLASVRAEQERLTIDALVHALDVSYPDDRFAAKYAEVLHHLRRRGRTVATMDLLIGVSALVQHARLATANRRHFEVIPGLDLVDY
jgi:tRNA(fMet)-specific endonuclease VapC